MKRFRPGLTALTILLLAGLLYWLLKTSASSGGAAEVPSDAREQDPAGLSTSAAPDDAAAAARVERAEAPQSAEPAPVASALGKTRLMFRGRCVAAETGAPLAGCTVKFHGWAGNDNLLAKHGEPDWKDPEPVVTGPDGVFAFDVPETLAFQFTLSARAPGRLGRSDRYDTEIPGGTDHDLGDVAFSRGAEITGMVRDETGGPVEKVTVLFQNLPMELRPGQGASDAAFASSAADGTFQLSDALPAGTWPIRLQSNFCTLVSPEAVTIEPGLAPRFVEVRVRRSPSIEGIVLDETGAPAAGVYVQTVRHSSGRMEGGWSGKDGQFRVYRQRDSEDPVQLTLEGGGLERLETAESHPWGARGVRLQARRLPSVPIVVREKGSGAPVEEFSVRCHGMSANSSAQTDFRLSGAHPGGLLTVDGVAFGENLLVVVPRDPALLRSAPLQFTAPRESPEPLLVELERMRPLQIQLLRGDGSPLAGSTAGLVNEAVHEVFSLRNLDPRNGGSFFGSKPPPVLWSTAVSGADGMVELHHPAGVPLAWLIVEGEHPRHGQEIPRPGDAAQPLRVTVPQGATLRGRLIHPQAGTGRIGVLVFQPERRHLGVEPWLVDREGAFIGRGLLPGAYSVHLIVRYDYQENGGGHGGQVEFQPALAQITMAAEETRELLLDASAYAFGSLHCRAAIPDSSASQLRLDLILMRPPGQEGWGNLGQFGEFTADATGHFGAENLPPGSYTAEARWTAADGSSRRLRSRNAVELPPGGQATGTFEFARLKLRLRITDAAGKPLAGVPTKPGRAPSAALAPQTDAEGWVEFDWLLAGRDQYVVVTEPPRYLPPLDVLADRDVTVVELRALTREELQAEESAGQKDG